VNIPDSTFEAVHDGMQGVMESGTGRRAKVPGIEVCGKTGTVENSYKGVKQKDHAFFSAFAPRRNPRIAIAVICENAGFGATSAAPIASLMIEKYLKDSIEGKERKDLVERISNMNLIPPRLVQALRTHDSTMHRRDSAYLIAKGYIKIARDTIGLEEEDEPEGLDKLKTEGKNRKPSPDTNVMNQQAVLPDNRRLLTDTAKNREN
jgi:penicillin-binding protein 2